MGAVSRPGRVLKGSLFLKYLCVRRRKRKYCTVFDIAGGLRRDIYVLVVIRRRLPSVESIFLIYRRQLFLETVPCPPPSFPVSFRGSIISRIAIIAKYRTTNVNIGAFSRGHRHSIRYINDIYNRDEFINVGIWEYQVATSLSVKLHSDLPFSLLSLSLPLYGINPSKGSFNLHRYEYWHIAYFPIRLSPVNPS